MVADVSGPVERSQRPSTLLRLIRAARPGNWWFSKIPPLLAVAYLGILDRGGDGGRAAVLLGCYLFSICLIAACGHVVNDACDVAADLGAGKANEMADVSLPRRVGLSVALVVVAFVPTWLAHYSVATLALLALNVVWPTVYSLPGLRLKERGVAGLVCDALGSHVTPTLVALSIFGAGSGSPASFFPAVMLAWATALGIKGILHHQMLDRANDLRSGTVTFATTVRPERLARFMGWFNLGVELPVSACVALVTATWAPLVAASFIIYCALEAAKYALGFQFALTSEAWTVRRSIPFTNESFYTLWLPFAAVVQLAASVPAWRWAPIAHLILFYPVFSAQIRELRAIIRVADLPTRVARWRR